MPVTGIEKQFIGCPARSLVSIRAEPSRLLLVHGPVWKVNKQIVSEILS